MPIHWLGAPAQDKKEMKHISERCCSEAPKIEACPVHWERSTSSQYTGNIQPGSQHHIALHWKHPTRFSAHCSLHWKHPTWFSHTVLYTRNTQSGSQYTALYTGSTQPGSQHTALSSWEMHNLLLNYYSLHRKHPI